MPNGDNHHLDARLRTIEREINDHGRLLRLILSRQDRSRGWVAGVAAAVSGFVTVVGIVATALLRGVL